MKRELTKQELPVRNFHSVKTLLPPDKMDDIAARELRPEEVSAILKEHGHPNVVTDRYGDPSGRVPIDPKLFPFYWSTLRGILGAWVIVRVIGTLFAFHGTSTAGSILLYLSRDITVSGFLIGVGVTAVFAVWEYLELPFPYPELWKAERLPLIPTAIRRLRTAQPSPMVYWQLPASFPPGRRVKGSSGRMLKRAPFVAAR